MAYEDTGIPLSPLLQRLGLPRALKPYRFYDTSLSPTNRIDNAFQVLGLDERRSPYVPSVWQKPAAVTTNLVQVWCPVRWPDTLHERLLTSYRGHTLTLEADILTRDSAISP